MYRYDTLLKLRQAALKGLRSQFQSDGDVWIDDIPTVVPVTGACENVDTLFALQGHHGLYLAQTGQLFLELCLSSYSSVYCDITSHRDEIADARHLSAFRLIEEEFRVDANLVGLELADRTPKALLQVLLNRIELGIKRAITSALKLESATLKAAGANIAALEALAETSFGRIRYEDAIKRVSDKWGEQVVFGKDLSPGEEQAVLAVADSGPFVPTFVTHFPTDLKFFNMMEDPENPQVVLSADLILPGVGEAVGAAVRESRRDHLQRRLTQSAMFQTLERRGAHSLDDFMPYIDAVTNGTIGLHAGYGLGLERLLAFVMGHRDLRDISGQHLLKQAMLPLTPTETAMPQRPARESKNSEKL